MRPYSFRHQVVKLHSRFSWLTMRPYSFHNQVRKLHSQSSWLTMRAYSFHHQVVKLHSQSSWLTIRPYSFHHQVVKLHSRSFWLTMRPYSFHHQVVKLHLRSSWLTMRAYSPHYREKAWISDLMPPWDPITCNQKQLRIVTTDRYSWLTVKSLNSRGRNLTFMRRRGRSPIVRSMKLQRSRSANRYKVRETTLVSAWTTGRSKFKIESSSWSSNSSFSKNGRIKGRPNGRSVDIKSFLATAYRQGLGGPMYYRANVATPQLEYSKGKYKSQPNVI